MPALQPREGGDQTGWWDARDVKSKVKGAGDLDLAIGPTRRTPGAVVPRASRLGVSDSDKVSK